jgi:hypothetical protein
MANNLPFMFLSYFIKGFSIRFETESDIYENRVYWAHTRSWTKDEMRRHHGGSAGLVGDQAT